MDGEQERSCGGLKEKIKRCGLCGSTKGVLHFFGVPYALKCKKCCRILTKYFKADDEDKKLWRWANGVSEPLKDEYDIGKRIAEIETLCGELKRVLDCAKKEGKLDGDVMTGTMIKTGKGKGKVRYDSLQSIKGGRRYGAVRKIRD